MADTKSNGKCDYCEDEIVMVRNSPYMGEFGKKICRNCWNIAKGQSQILCEDELVGF